MSANPTNILPFPHAKPTLEEAVAAFIEAKRKEDAAKTERLVCEELICQLQPPKQEGAMTVEDGGYKVTLTGKLTYRVTDMAKLLEICSKLPENMRPLKTETVLDETGAKYLRNNETEVWAMLAPAIEIKPAKTAIKVSV